MRSPTLKYFLEKRHVDHGGAMVEFAIVLPLLLILVFGIIEFGILLYNKAVLTNASREGARRGIFLIAYDPDTTTYTYSSSDDIEGVVVTYCQDRLIPKTNPLDPAKIYVTYEDISSPIGKNSTGDKLTVSVQYDYSFFLISGLLSSLGTSIPLEGETVMLLE